MFKQLAFLMRQVFIDLSHFRWQYAKKEHGNGKDLGVFEPQVFGSEYENLDFGYVPVAAVACLNPNFFIKLDFSLSILRLRYHLLLLDR